MKYKRVLIILALGCTWLFLENWILDLLIPIIIILLLIDFLKKKQFICFLFGLVITFLMMVDINYTYKNCQKKLDKFLVEKKCFYQKGLNLKPFRENSYLYKEKGIGTVCQIYIQVNKKRVFIQNPLLETVSYKKEKCKK